MDGSSPDDIAALSRSELEEHARSLRAVVSVSDAVHLSNDFADLVERAVDAIVTYTRYPSVGLFRVNRAEARVELVAIRGFGDDVVASVQTLPLEGSLTGEAVRTRAVVTTHDLAADERLEPKTRRLLELEGFVEVASVPVLYKEEVIGALNLIYKEASNLSAHERSVLLSIGRTIGIAMYNRLAAEERRAIEERLRHAEQLENIGTLAGGIAHDFNNLLTAIIGAISLARTKSADPGLTALLRDAESGCERASGLVRQLLTFSRGGAPLKRPTADVATIVREAAQFVLRGRDTPCQVRVIGELGVMQIDPAQLAQVVENLVLNASQASSAGKPVIVTLERRTLATPEGSSPESPHLVLSVRDEGAGIPAEQLSRIFDPYFTTRATGSGIGLATTHSIVSRHGGRIRVDSEVGRGSTFYVEIPFQEAEAVDEPPAPPSAPRSHLRVLVVDDDRMVRTVLRRMLLMHDHEVDEAADGPTALRLFQQAHDEGRPYDLVILDLTLVGSEGGVEVMQQLLAIDPDVRTIVSSGYSEDAAMARYAEHGFSAVLPKPYTPKDLDEAVAAALLPQR